MAETPLVGLPEAPRQDLAEPFAVAGLTARVGRSALWTLASRLLLRLSDFVRVALLARMLRPEDFGLFGMVMTGIVALESVSQLGLNTALVRRRTVTREVLDTAWLAQVVRGAVLATVLALAAPLLARYFREPRLVSLIQVVSAAHFIQGLSSIGLVFIEREMQFQKQFFFDLTANMVGLAVGVSLAWWQRSAWALVWANLAVVSTKTVTSYVFAAHWPRWRFDKDLFGELFHLGRWMTGIGIVMFFVQHLDKLVIGRICGAAVLGPYQMAQRLADLPIAQPVVASVAFTFPAYSKLQREPSRLKTAYLDIHQTLAGIVIPVSVVVVILARQVVMGLLGPGWDAAVVPLQLLALASLVDALQTITTPLFLALGRPHYEFTKSVLRGAVLAVGLIPLTYWGGPEGACLAILAASAASVPVLGALKSVAGISFREWTTGLVPGAVTAVTAAICTLPVAVWAEAGWTALLLGGLTSGAAFVLTSVLLQRFFRCGVFHQLRRVSEALRDETIA